MPKNEIHHIKITCDICGKTIVEYDQELDRCMSSSLLEWVRDLRYSEIIDRDKKAFHEDQKWYYMCDSCTDEFVKKIEQNKKDRKKKVKA